MSSVIWIWTLNSVIVSGKRQIVLHRLYLQQHSKNTRNFSSTASTTLLDPHTWRKPKHDTWNQRRNISVRTRLWSMGNSQRNTSIWSRTRYKAFTGEKSIAHCILYKDADDISDDNTDDTSFVYKIQTLLVEFLKQRLPNVTKIYYVSDGCGAQYKTFKNFLNICSPKEDFSIKAE